MSTYTDLHNKVKEGVVVNCHKGFDDDRITFQEVKLLNPNNLYRGTFTGQMNVENSNLVGGVISGCTIHDVTMYNINWPGGQRIDECMGMVTALSGDIRNILNNDLPLVNAKITNETASRMSADSILDTKIEIAYERIHNLSDIALPEEFRALSGAFTEKLNKDIKQVSNDITADVYAISTYLSADYTANDSYLSSNIDKLSAKISAEVISLSTRLSTEISQLSDNMSADIQTLSINLSDDLAYEKFERYENDKDLSSKCRYLNSTLESEINRSTQYDEALALSVYNNNISSLTRDTKLSDALSIHNLENIRDLENTKNYLLSAIEKDKHYQIYGEAGKITANSYPYLLKDYSVNIIKAAVKDGFVKFSNRIIGSVDYTYNVDGTIQKVHLILSNFKMFSQLINLFDDPYQLDMIPNVDYINPKPPNSYKIRFETDLVTGEGRITIAPITYEYYTIAYQDQVIGQMHDTKLTRTQGDIEAGVSSIVSCRLTMTVKADDPDFGIFAREGFDKSTFIADPTYNQRKVDKFTERIALADDNRTFTFYKGLSAISYLPLVDIKDEANEEFARIRQGNVIVKDGNIDTMTVAVLADPSYNIPKDVPAIILNTSNGFLNSVTDNMFLSGNVTTTNCKFLLLRSEKYYKYNYYDATDTELTGEPFGYIVPDVYNQKLPEADPQYLSVFIDKCPEELKTIWPSVYKLTHDGGIAQWTYDSTKEIGSVATNLIRLVYNKTGSVLTIDGYAEEYGFDFHGKYKVKLPADSSDPQYPPYYLNIEEVKRYTKNVSVTDDSEYTRKTETWTARYQYVGFNGPYSPTKPEDPYTLDIENATNKAQQFIIPNKEDYKYSKSREMLLASYFISNNDLVKYEFIHPDGTPITIWNDRLTELYLPANIWSTVLITEVAQDKFLITDLDDNKENYLLSVLSAKIDNEIETRTTQVNYLSTQHDELCSNLSITLSTLRNEFDVVSSDLYTLSNDISGISSNFDGRISQNKAYIDDIYKLIKGGLNYKGVFDLDITRRDHAENNSISALFYNNLWTPSTSEYPEQILSIQLRQGFYWILDAKQNPLSTFNYGGLNLQKNDWLIIKTNTAVSSITSAEVDVMDALDNDVFHLSGNGQVVRGDNFFYGKQYFEELSVSDLTVTAVSAISLTADNALISNLTCNMELQVSSLGVNDISAYRMYSISSRISTLTVLNDATIETADISTLSSNSLSSINTNIQYNVVNEETVQKLSVDNLSATFTTLQTANVSDLTVTNEVVDNISASTISAAIVDVIDSGISNLTATNEIVTNLTAANSELSNVGISNLTATNETVANLTATNETVTNLTVTNSELSNANISNLVANVEVVSVLTATSLSSFELSANTEYIEYSNIDKLTVNAQADVNVMNVQELTSYGTLLSGLTEISNATVNNLSVASLSQLSVMDKVEYRYGDPNAGISCISSLQDVLDLSVDNLTDTISAVSSYIYDRHYATNLSTDITIEMGNCPHSTKPTKIVDLLLIRDEMTFNLYRLTIRNGALNINLVEEYK